MDTTPIAWAVLVARLPAVAALPFDDAAALAAASLEDLGRRTADAIDVAMSPAEKALCRLGAVQGRLTDTAGHTASVLATARHRGTAAAAYRDCARDVLAELADEPRSYLAAHPVPTKMTPPGASWNEQAKGTAVAPGTPAHFVAMASLATTSARKAFEEARRLLLAAWQQRTLTAAPQPGWEAEDHRLWAEILDCQAKDVLGTARAHLGAAQRFTDQARRPSRPEGA